MFVLVGFRRQSLLYTCNPLASGHGALLTECACVIQLPPSSCTAQFDTLSCSLLLVTTEFAAMLTAVFVQVMHTSTQAFKKSRSAFQIGGLIGFEMHFELPPPTFYGIQIRRALGEQGNLVTPRLCFGISVGRATKGTLIVFRHTNMATRLAYPPPSS